LILGAVFYPTKNIEEKLSQKYEQEIASLKEQHSKELATSKETLDASVKQFNQQIAEKEKKISVLTSQVTDLKSKQKTAYYKVIKPDGTIEIKKFSETEVSESTKVVTQIQEEFKEKLASIEKKYEEIHTKRVTELKKEFDSKEQEYKKTITSLEQSKSTNVNPKRFGAEVGSNTERQYYVHGTGTLVGPLFLGIHGESNREMDKKSIGLGVGINF
jgi:chromosome segregation ATPase